MKDTIQNFKINFLSKFILILFILATTIVGCNNKTDCIQQQTEKEDTTLEKEALEYNKILLDRFKEPSIKNDKNDAYHLQFYSSHGFGESVKFEKCDSGYFLYVSCIVKKKCLSKCKDLKIKINKDDWDGVEKIIEEFDFWTEPIFRKNEGVLDGYVYFLEGNKINPKNGDKTYRIVGRSSMQYDKIEVLCEYIIKYKEELQTK